MFPSKHLKKNSKSKLYNRTQLQTYKILKNWKNTYMKNGFYFCLARRKLQFNPEN